MTLYTYEGSALRTDYLLVEAVSKEEAAKKVTTWLVAHPDENFDMSEYRAINADDFEEVPTGIWTHEDPEFWAD